ncbi:MerC domain-containing protein [Sphingomonas sp.]|uniref:MerC domain-containing protein n=1 Tax=Sphingomonas sp. TaxID=28214 RepID=UPI0025FA91DE|nr:MerC domain-containing protein [Sphingomonas sp.]MBV9527356.1 MerC domain-containing protein [Sphingomonas sp.]
MGLSGLCVVHCVATAVLVGLLASAGGFLGSPIIHETGLTIAMIIGTIALGRGVMEHGLMLPSAVGALGLGIMAGALSLPEGGHEPVYTVLGVCILALGHRLNVLAGRGRL